MRRLSTFALALLTVLIGVTAWAQATDRGPARTPRAAGEVKFVSADPADGSTVTELSVLLTKWSTEVGFEWGTDLGTVVDAEGNKVATLDFSMAPNGDYTEANIEVKPAITTPGEYTVTIFEDTIFEDFGGGSTGNSCEQVVLHYTVGAAEPTAPVMTSYTPSVPVKELSSVEVTFDQPVVLSRGAAMMLVPLYEVGGMDPVARGSVTAKEGDDTTIVYTFAPTQVPAGEYELIIEEGTVASLATIEDEEPLVNEYTLISLTVAGGDNPAPTLEAKISAPVESEITGDSFGTINVDFKEKVTCQSKTIDIVSDKGSKVTLELSTSFMDSGTQNTILIFTDEIQESGVWTLTFPAGFFTNSKGAKSEELTRSWDFTYTAGGNDDGDDRRLEIISARLVKGDEVVELKEGAAISSMGEGWTLEVVPNIIDKAEQINMSVTYVGKDADGNDEPRTLKAVEMYRLYNDGSYRSDLQGDKFVKELAGKVEPLKDVIYTVTFDAINNRVSPDQRKDWGEVSFTITGTNEPFKYSDIKVLAIEPDPETHEIRFPDEEFVIKFSGPVTIDEAESGQNEGQGMRSSFRRIYPNDDRTIWTFTPTESFLSMQTAEAGFFILAKDENGLIVEGDNGEGLSSRITVYYDCHIGNPALIVSPGRGVVKSLYEFSVKAANGMSIGLGDAALKPYVTTMSGAVVAQCVMDSEKGYLADGTLVPDNYQGDVTVDMSVWNLDKEITAPGKYILNIPYAAYQLGAQFNSAFNRTTTIEYEIEGTPVYDGCTLADGELVNKLSFAGFRASQEVELRENAKINLRDDEGIVKAFDILMACSNGMTTLLADFTDFDFEFVPGQEYTLGIPANRVKLAGTENYFPAISVKIVGADSDMQTVSLTHTVAGHASSVSEVAMGRKVTVNLTPAEGWKIDKVTFNDSDVTAEVANGVYTTPELKANSELEATYAFAGEVFTPESAADMVTDFRLSAWSENGEIVVKGLQNGMVVNVFSVAGAAVGSHTVAENMDILRMSLPEGVYVVTVTFEGKTQAIKLQNK